MFSWLQHPPWIDLKNPQEHSRAKKAKMAFGLDMYTDKSSLRSVSSSLCPPFQSPKQWLDRKPHASGGRDSSGLWGHQPGDSSSPSEPYVVALQLDLYLGPVWGRGVEGASCRACLPRAHRATVPRMCVGLVLFQGLLNALSCWRLI